MAGNNAIKFFRGTEEKRLASTEVLNQGQPFYETDTGKFYIGDGVTSLQNMVDISNSITLPSDVLLQSRQSVKMTASTTGSNDGTTTWYTGETTVTLPKQCIEISSSNSSCSINYNASTGACSVSGRTSTSGGIIITSLTYTYKYQYML